MFPLSAQESSCVASVSSIFRGFSTDCRVVCFTSRSLCFFNLQRSLNRAFQMAVKCDKCAVKCDSSTDLAKHVRAKHGSFKCTFNGCKKAGFETFNALVAHQAVHKPKFQCGKNKCKMIFESAGELKSHKCSVLQLY